MDINKSKETHGFFGASITYETKYDTEYNIES
mgnify:CR=1 FL=1